MITIHLSRNKYFRFCCDDPPRQTIKSDSNEMLVLFRTFHESRVCDDIKYPWKCMILYTGFMAKYHIGKGTLHSTRKLENVEMNPGFETHGQSHPKFKLGVQWTIVQQFKKCIQYVILR